MSHLLALTLVLGTMQTHLMTDRVADGAVCLDGTPAGYAFRPAADLANANDWQIYFEGGGWCFDKADCARRADSNLGSSKAWPSNVTADGIMSEDCTVNPDFCNFNRVYMFYCDGNSFSGNREDAVVFQNKNLYFRGKQVLDAILADLVANRNLKAASRVVLTGCSAGGLATYLHTDYVHEWAKATLPSLEMFKAVSISGFFLDHANVEGTPVYATQMQNIFQLSNASANLNKGCLAANTGPDSWKCNFAQYTYEHIQAPVMVLNSALDSWQTECIFCSLLPVNFPNQQGKENGNCSAIWDQCAHGPDECNSTQIVEMNSYLTSFEAIIGNIGTYSKAGNAAFIHSCHLHCEAQSGHYNIITVGNTTMQQAVSRWWASEVTAPAFHTTPCQYHTESGNKHRDCNLSCLKGE